MEVGQIHVKVGNMNDFPQQLGRSVQIDFLELALFRTSEEQWYALENRTPHAKGGPLSEGIVSGHFVHCPLRDWKIDLRTGKAQAPDEGQVITYPVHVTPQGEVMISIPLE